MLQMNTPMDLTPKADKKMTKNIAPKGKIKYRGGMLIG